MGLLKSGMSELQIEQAVEMVLVCPRLIYIGINHITPNKHDGVLLNAGPVLASDGPALG